MASFNTAHVLRWRLIEQPRPEPPPLPAPTTKSCTRPDRKIGPRHFGAWHFASSSCDGCFMDPLHPATPSHASMASWPQCRLAGGSSMPAQGMPSVSSHASISPLGSERVPAGNASTSTPAPCGVPAGNASISRTSAASFPALHAPIAGGQRPCGAPVAFRRVFVTSVTWRCRP